jgi:hypothetical protein
VKAIFSILRYTTSPGLLSPSERLPGEDSEHISSLVGGDLGLCEAQDGGPGQGWGRKAGLCFPPPSIAV